MKRNKDGTFAVGNKGGGRKKGSPNRATADVRKFLNELILENQDQIRKDFEQLEPKERIRFMIELAKIVLPALQSIHYEDLSSGAVKVADPFAQMRLNHGLDKVE